MQKKQSPNSSCNCDCNRLKAVLDKYENDPTRLMDILIDVQGSSGCISSETVSTIADALKKSKVDIEQTLSFYHFFSEKPTGKYAVYLNDSVVACIKRKEYESER